VKHCHHPYCPLRESPGEWTDLVDHGILAASAAEREALSGTFKDVDSVGGAGKEVVELPFLRKTVCKRLLRLAPCLYTQVDVSVSAPGVVHLCEVTLKKPIRSDNVEEAFAIQHPKVPTKQYLHPPLVPPPKQKAGAIVEEICSRLLTNEGLPPMGLVGRWPNWKIPAHVTLNSGKFSALKLYGDILIPAAPHNILISVKTQKARERFVLSGNRLESVGFGFFNQPNEFTSVLRMKQFKRWGFLAIYMPQDTLSKVEERLLKTHSTHHAINANGTPLYRSICTFTEDMKRVAGKISLVL
jgi:hypothetical protein